MHLSVEEQRRAISRWLRTGLLPVARLAGGLELKFNPYHDPRNGRFTFATGVGVGQSAHLAPAQEEEREPRFGRGGNIRAFDDPMTLEEAIPALKNSIAGAILAIPNALFDLSGPASELQREVIDRSAQKALDDIRRVDPSFHYDELGPIETIEGRRNRLDDIRVWRARIYMTKLGDYGPLQVEALRIIRSEVDDAYENGMKLLRRGKLSHGPTDRVKLGNYIDREVRRSLRERFASYGIKMVSEGRVRINRRENSTLLGKHAIPDVRIHKLAIDPSLQGKDRSFPQVRLFFETDFTPDYVAIMRPRLEAKPHSYIIKR